MERDHPLRSHHPRRQVLHVEWLRQVVIGARLPTVQVVLLIAQRREQDEVGVRRVVLAHSTAQLRSLDPRHEPIADDDVGALIAKDTPRLLAIARGNDDVALPLDQIDQQLANARVILGDQYPHVCRRSVSLKRLVSLKTFSLSYTSTAATRSAISRKSAMRYGLAMTSSTPLARASFGSMPAPQPVTSTKRVVGQYLRTSAATSHPFLPAPSPRSEMTSSNDSSRKRCSAASPEVATTTWCPRWVSTREAIFANCSSSSTTSTR